jgi:phage portal protein BeeE
MGPLGRLYDGVVNFAKALRPSRGKVRSSIGGWFGGSPTGWRAWSGDPYQQITEYRNWVYTSVHFRALKRQTPPLAVRYVKEDEVEQEKFVRQKAYLAGQYVPKRKMVKRSKSVGSAQNRVGFEMEYLPADSDVMRLLHNPNDPQIGVDLWFMCSIFEDLTGRCHIWKVRNGAGKIVELWYIPTQWVDPRPGNGRLIDFYRVTMPSGGTEDIDADDIITIGEPSPFGYVAWQSPLQAHGLTVDLNNALLVSRFNGLTNGAQVGTLIKVPSSMSNDPEKMQRLEASLMSRIVGAVNYNRPLIAEEGAELINLTPQIELAFSESSEKMRDNIFAAFDLDASVMGYANNSTYAGSIITDRNIWKKIVKPYHERRNATLTERLLHEFGDDLVAINEYQTEESPDEKRDRIRLMADLQAITVNEVREEFDREPFDDPRYDEPIGAAGDRAAMLDMQDMQAEFGVRAPGGQQVESNEGIDDA